MKLYIPLVCALLLSGAPALAHAKITRTIEKTFAVQPGGRLRAETQGGNITIRTDDANEVRMVVTQVIDVNSEEAASKVLEKLNLSLEQKGNEVSAIATYEKRLGNVWGHWPPVQVSYTITVPRAFNVQLNTSGGNIKVASLKGSVNARTSGGNLMFERIDGELVGTTSGGNVSARLTEPPQQDMTLRTSGGNVTVSVPRSAAFQLEAETSGGDVTTRNLTLSHSSTNKSKTQLSATINTGGPTLTLRTSGGDIQVSAD